MRNAKHTNSHFTFEACEPRQLMAAQADLVVGSMTCSDPMLPAQQTYGHFQLGITNAGDASVGSDFTVSLYSVTNYYDPEPLYLTSTRVSGIGGWQTKVLNLTATLASSPTNLGYVIAKIDSGNEIAESNENNNWYQGLGKDMVKFSCDADVSAPAGSVTPRGLNLDGKWIDGVIGTDEPLIGYRDIDSYKVSLVAGHKYWFEAYETGGSLDLAMRVMGGNFQTFATSYGDPVRNGKGSYIEFTPTVTNDYWVAISTQQNVGGNIMNFDNRNANGGMGKFKIAAAEVMKPDVYISSMDSAGVEGSPSDPNSGLEITVRRQWVDQPWRPQTVKLSWAGQFTAGDLDKSLPTELTIPANEYSVTWKAMPSDDGVNEMPESETVTIVPDGSFNVLSGYGSQTLTILDNPATHHPFWLSKGFNGLDRSGPRTVITFSEDVGYSITRDDYVLKNLTTGAVVPVDKYHVVWSPTVNASIVYFDGYANGQLPDGNYRMTLYKNGVYTWPATQRLTEDVVIDFTSLNGDTNADRKVDFNDLVTLAQHYGATTPAGEGASVGDFNRDGKIDFDDLVALARNYGKQFPAPTAVAGSSAASVIASGGDSKRDRLFSDLTPIL